MVIAALLARAQLIGGVRGLVGLIGLSVCWLWVFWFLVFRAERLRIGSLTNYTHVDRLKRGLQAYLDFYNRQ